MGVREIGGEYTALVTRGIGLLYIWDMKIAVNTRWLLPGKLEGTGVYTMRMLEQIIPAFPEHTFYLLYDREPGAPEAELDFSNVVRKVVAPQARHPWLWLLWNEVTVPRQLAKIGADVYWSPDGLPAKTDVPQWITIHDLNFEHHPEWLKHSVAKFYKEHVRKSAEVAQRLFTVSRWSKEDIVRTYGIDGDSIQITPNAPKHVVQASEYAPKPYFCAVGAITPRKSLITLIKAFNHWIEEHPEREGYTLKIAGAAHRSDEGLQEELARLKYANQIEFLGRLTDEDLHALYADATAFCMPSAMEGFGIPVLEAMQSGTPVVSSRNSALEELVEGAGLLVPTYDIFAWTKALETMCETGKQWVKPGIERAGEYRWADNAKPIMDALKSLSS